MNHSIYVIMSNILFLSQFWSTFLASEFGYFLFFLFLEHKTSENNNLQRKLKKKTNLYFLCLFFQIKFSNLFLTHHNDPYLIDRNYGVHCYGLCLSHFDDEFHVSHFFFSKIWKIVAIRPKKISFIFSAVGFDSIILIKGILII